MLIMAIHPLYYLFNPRAIAVVGASRNPRKIGHIILRNILESGYRGRVYPVNPNADAILGLRAYPRVSLIPDSVDVAIIAIPAPKVPEVAEDAGRAGVRFLVVISSGFKEAGHKELEDRLVAIARKYGMRVLGPNVAGYVYTPARINATFGPTRVLPGNIAFVTQSGAFAIALMGSTLVEGIGVSAIVSVGNKADICDSDLLDYFRIDEHTRVVLFYLEWLRDGRRFLDTLAKTVLEKPVVVIKAGRTKAGSRAAASHTGRMAGSFRVYSAALRQNGALLALSMEEAFDAAKALAWNPLPRLKGRNEVNILVMTNGGGAGIQATDTLAGRGFSLREPPAELRRELEGVLPPFASIRNPIDLTGMAPAEWFYDAIRVALRSPWVDALLVLYVQTGISGPVETAKAIKDAIHDEGYSKPVTVAFLGGPECLYAARLLTKERIPAYPTPERAATALAFIAEYMERREYVSRRLKELGVAV